VALEVRSPRHCGHEPPRILPIASVLPGHALNALKRPVEPLATTRCSVCRGNERGRAHPFVRQWPKVAGARLPPSPPAD
jgi:hypothetical protein